MNNLIDLGPYTVRKPRPDGLIHAAFYVPAHIAPAGFKRYTRVPEDGGPIDPDDPAQVTKARLEVEGHYQRLQAAIQRDRSDDRDPATWAGALKLFLAAPDIDERMGQQHKQNYIRHGSIFAEDLDHRPGMSPIDITPAKGAGYLGGRFIHNSPTLATALCVMRGLLDLVAGEGLRPPHMQVTLKVTRQIEVMPPWELEDVEAVQRFAEEHEQASLGALIRLNWQVGQRLGDMRDFRQGRHYVDGVLRIDQSKTSAAVDIALPDSVRALLDGLKVANGDFLFKDVSGDPFTASRLAHAWRALRAKSPAFTAKRLLIGHLRHSAVCQMARAGCSVLEISSVTGHSPETVHRIIQRYFRRDSICATNAMLKVQAMHRSRIPGRDETILVDGEPRRYLPRLH